MEDPMHERWLAELHPAERPRYFSGKLLSVDDLEKEQDYWRRQRQLHNRFELGPGVICGLDVTPLPVSSGTGIRVSAGVALDGWGREIVIPTEIELVPLRLSEDCDSPPEGDELPPAAHITVRYRELAGGRQPVIAGEPQPAADALDVGSLVEESAKLCGAASD